MKIDRNRIYASAIDLKNLFLLGEWYREVLEYEMKFDPMLDKDGIKQIVNELIVNLYAFGFMCLPTRWTTFSKEWLDRQLKNVDSLTNTVKHHFGNDDMEYKLFNKISKFYLEAYIKCVNDKTWNKRNEFEKNNLNETQIKKYLDLYMRILSICENEGWCVFHVCEELETWILAQRN